jgi:hypothetical protein
MMKYLMSAAVLAIGLAATPAFAEDAKAPAPAAEPAAPHHHHWHHRWHHHWHPWHRHHWHHRHWRHHDAAPPAESAPK